MLVLTRRVSEKIIIGDNVTVSVLGVKGNQVRIGIEAPNDVKVNREEIHQRSLKEQKALNDTHCASTPTNVLSEIRKAIRGTD